MNIQPARAALAQTLRTTAPAKVATKAQLAPARPVQAVSAAREVNTATYDEVLAAMERAPYSRDALPTIDLSMFKWLGQRLSFFVGKRSKEILTDKRDFRAVGMEKPIHPMGVGFEATVTMKPSRWSGAFAGGEFLALGRASLSQGNPLRTLPDGSAQIRSTAMAIKLFPTKDRGQAVHTANIVTENDLNGVLGADGKAIRYLEASQSNAPPISIFKIRHGYEVLTLLGVAWGALRSPFDKVARAGVRPPHAWGEIGAASASAVKTPPYLEIRPKLRAAPVDQSDFRLEIVDTLKREGKLTYEIVAADAVDAHGVPKWESVGEMTIHRGILSEGVDQNVLFPHSTFNSQLTKKPFALPEAPKQHGAWTP